MFLPKIAGRRRFNKTNCFFDLVKDFINSGYKMVLNSTNKIISFFDLSFNHRLDMLHTKFSYFVFLDPNV